ncbi:tryptophan 2,3-dioxygenase family protein [Thermogemmatispora onikobensis]|uniref:tryptophan 2,3-dioxygenase family protein n=1 Tax=Thermogemmatispora onikobensis TaxID=732234 RepID=UPI000853BA73|nr:tryptophan 2,3-dioxygenase family protein [Thermogemmatispora onikobensis]
MSKRSEHVEVQRPARRESVYARYLRLSELLSLQKPEEELAHHDELQFQIVHQVFELWWKETAFELRSISRLLKEANLHEALRLLQRVIRIQYLLLENMRMLETMSPWDFHAFRKLLAGGAGSDSPGYRELQRLSPPLWDDFRSLLAAAGASLSDVYLQAGRYPLLHAFAEALIDYDEVMQTFRFRHYKLAERMIGATTMGTGGTPMPLLERTTHDMFYPELWEVRNRLSALAQEQGQI